MIFGNAIKNKKAKTVYTPGFLETIIYDKVDKRKYPKIHKAQKSNNNKGSGKINSQSGQDDSLFKIGVGDKMDFGNAIRELKNGKALYRKGWNGKNICIKLMKASDSQDMTQDYIYIDTTNLKTDNRDAPKSKVPWLASQTDLLANDWEIDYSKQVNQIFEVIENRFKDMFSNFDIDDSIF